MRHNIIRIQHPSNGLGLWRTFKEAEPLLAKHSKYDDIAERHANSNLYPTYCNDTQLNCQISWEDVQQYNFAFKDLAQLETALTREELKECIEVLGFQVLMLDVTDYYESPYQIVFKKESIVNQKDISSMFL